MLVSDFHFDLPDDLIAQHPPAIRGSSRMMCVDRSTGGYADDSFINLPDHLRAGDLLILNDSRVLPARLYAHRAGLKTQSSSPAPSASIEVLLTHQRGEHEWSALVRPGRKVKPGETLLFPDDTGMTLLKAEIVDAGEFGERTLRFAPDPCFLQHLDRIGHVPLPPYIRREDEANDKSRYQTVYAASSGSAAAPTAGLHFTPEVLSAITAKGVEIQRLTLHVGLGTFQPVRVERVEDIHLHTEHYTLPAGTAAAIQSARKERRRVVAVGTTATRTLEHCAAIDRLEPHSGSTAIFIAPGHRFRIVSGLLTNFHLPQSTLLMLVSALLNQDPETGRDHVLSAYAHAIEQRYRFFSYGDCMLIQ